MAYEPLTPDDIQMGAAAVGEFRRLGHNVSAAFWFYQTDAERWRLTIATPAAEHGSRALYLDLIQARVALDTGRISFVTPDDPIAMAFARRSTTPSGAARRVHGSIVDDVFVQDAWVYPLPPIDAPLTTT